MKVRVVDEKLKKDLLKTLLKVYTEEKYALTFPLYAQELTVELSGMPYRKREHQGCLMLKR